MGDQDTSGSIVVSPLGIVTSGGCWDVATTRDDVAARAGAAPR